MTNFLNLEYFLVVTEELNFIRAVKQPYIFQQSLSSHIFDLEKESDVGLSHRTPPLTLTYAGQALRAKTKAILDLQGETCQKIADTKDFSERQLTIGVSHTRGCKILPEILSVYKERFPGIQLHLKEGNSSELDASLLHGNVDLIIGLLPFKVGNIETVPICEEEILLVIPGFVLEKAFPGRPPEIRQRLTRDTDLSLLKECPFLLINPGNRVRTLADEIFKEAQLTPNTILETENIETVMALAARGMDITLYPEMFISSHTPLQNLAAEHGGLNFYSLNHPRTHSVLAIGHHKGHHMSRATKEFTNIAKGTI